MVVAKKNYNNYGYIEYGNTAIDYDKYNYHEKSDETKSKNSKKNNVKNIKKKLKLLAFAISIFCVGTLIIGRYAMIMNLNNQVIDLKHSIINNQNQNENLKIELMKFCDITQIEKTATLEFGMIQPDGHNIVYLEGEEQISNINDKISEKSQKVSIMDKIIKFFY